MSKIVLVPSAVTMSSIEIANLTEKDHKHVIRDIRVMLDELCADGPNLGHLREDKDARGYTAMFHLDRELTDTLLTGYSAIARRKVIARWHKLEGGATDPVKVLNDPSKLREMLLGYTEKVIALEHQIEAAKPAVEFVAKYVQAEGLKGFREVAKLLKANEARFREFLIDQKIMYRLAGVLTAFANHVDAGRFEVRAGVANDREYIATKFTPKGVDWIAGEWAKHTLRDGEAV